MQRGDHLVTPRTGYTHHGIYLGGDEVIHYSGFSEFGKGGPIEKVSLKAFAQGKNIRVKQHSSAKFDPEKRIDRALSRIGEESYNLALNNCEHFVHWCIYGESESLQVENVAAGVSGLAARSFVAPALVKGAAFGLFKFGAIGVASAALVPTAVVPTAVSLGIAAVTVAGAAGGKKLIKKLSKRKGD